MKKHEQGATVIEFALSMLVFLTFLLGITDFGRMLFTWNAASEATRFGARYAVTCDSTMDEAEVLERMQRVLPQIASIDMQWVPVGCDPTNCEGVNVTVTNLNYQWISPVAGAVARSFPMPGFSTFLPREIMKQDPNSDVICAP